MKKFILLIASMILAVGCMIIPAGAFNDASEITAEDLPLPRSYSASTMRAGDTIVTDTSDPANVNIALPPHPENVLDMVSTAAVQSSDFFVGAIRVPVGSTTTVHITMRSLRTTTLIRKLSRTSSSPLLLIRSRSAPLISLWASTAPSTASTWASRTMGAAGIPFLMTSMVLSRNTPVIAPPARLRTPSWS